MINFVSGNILHSDAEAIVNTVNCVGIMGRGIALQFKKAYPENFSAYAKACKLEEVVPGKMFVFETGQQINPKFIINFPTKRHWKGASRIEDIDSGLLALKYEIQQRKISSIAIPPLGAGLGGLDWNVVKEKMELALAHISEDVKIVIYEPNGAPENDKMVKPKKIPKMTEGRAILIELIDRYLKGLLDPYITLLEVHKLMYFVQESGQNLKLKYSKGPYGPYAENLRHVLIHLEGYYISGYSDGGDDPRKIINLVPHAVEEAKIFLNDNADIRQKFDRVSDLIEGFESSDGLELLATTHWLKTKENLKSSKDLIQGFHSWNERKKRFTERQITVAKQVLDQGAWGVG